MAVSYGEIAALQNDFDKQCEELGVAWTDDEVRNEAFCEFVTDYEDGEEPEVRLCGYGYEMLN